MEPEAYAIIKLLIGILTAGYAGWILTENVFVAIILFIAAFIMNSEALGVLLQ